ncbi:MAG: ACT domain-containing protein [Actinomycetota bacterium]|nr:ACT domain-containing protein [Actinomycetota bacterium]
MGDSTASKSVFAVTVVGADRPGIVAAVTRVLYELGCNLEDVTSTILRGHFTMVLVVRAPEPTDEATLERALQAPARELGLTVTARPVERGISEPSEPTHMVSVYGADRPGIVFRVAETLAGAGINITDLTSRLIDSQQQPVYALMLEVSAPENLMVEPVLDALRAELGVDLSVHPIGADVL